MNKKAQLFSGAGIAIVAILALVAIIAIWFIFGNMYAIVGAFIIHCLRL